MNTPRRVLLLCSVLLCAMMTTLSVLRYTSYNATMQDLGHMTQAIWSVSEGRPLEYTREDGRFPVFSRLAWHAELVYFPISLLYRVFPSPVTLLVLQSVWVAAGAYPLYLIASRRLRSEWTAVIVSLIYLLYPVAQTAVLFDFHGDTLAMPTLLFALAAVENRHWTRYAVYVAVALSCKIYVFVPVAAMGAVLWLRGQRRVGWLTLIGALMWGSSVILLIRPSFAPGAAYDEDVTSLVSYLHFYFGLIRDIAPTFVHRAIVAVIVLAPVSLFIKPGFLWVVPAMAVVAPVLLSDGPGPSYHYTYHHYATAVPFLMMMVIRGTWRLQRQDLRILKAVSSTGQGLQMWPVSLGASLIITLLIGGYFVDVPYNRRFWESGPPLRPREMSYWPTARDIRKHRWVEDVVPAEVPLAASVGIAPHVANRKVLFTTYNLEGNLGHVEYAIFDALFDRVVFLGDGSFAGGATYDISAIELLLRDSRFVVIESYDGLILSARQVGDLDQLFYEVEVLPESRARSHLKNSV